MQSHSPTASPSHSSPGGLSGLHPGPDPRVSDHSPSRPPRRFTRRWLVLPLLAAVVSFAYAHHRESQQLQSWSDQRQPLLQREQQELGALHREVGERESRLQSQTRMIDHLTRRAAFQREELQQLRVALDERGRQLEDLRATVPALQAQLTELENASATETRRLSTIENENLELGRTRDELRRELEAARARLEQTRERHRSETELRHFREGSR